MKIAITGAAGLVGQNLIARLQRQGGYDIVAIDKHGNNIHVLRQLHPDITVIEADLAQPGGWEHGLDGVAAVVIAHAQIGGLSALNTNVRLVGQ